MRLLCSKIIKNYKIEIISLALSIILNINLTMHDQSFYSNDMDLIAIACHIRIKLYGKTLSTLFWIDICRYFHRSFNVDTLDNFDTLALSFALSIKELISESKYFWSF